MLCSISSGCTTSGLLILIPAFFLSVVKVTSTLYRVERCLQNDRTSPASGEEEMRAVAYKARPARGFLLFLTSTYCLCDLTSRLLGVAGSKLLDSGGTAPHGAVVMLLATRHSPPAMARRTQLFAREAAGGRAAAAVHHWPDDAL